jgi:outer membrane protein OmpA-like peptidoglycan-associated protein
MRQSPLRHAHEWEESMHNGIRAFLLAATACVVFGELTGCASSYYYFDSENYIREGFDSKKYRTAAILYFGYAEASTVVEHDQTDVKDVTTRSAALKEQDVIMFSNALISELSNAGITIVERSRVNDLVREQGLIVNEFVDLSDVEKVRRVGKLLKADLLIKGSVFTLLGGYRISRHEKVYHVILLGLAVRAIDSRTGQIVWSDVATVASRRVPEDIETDVKNVSDYTVVREMVHKMVARLAASQPPRAAPQRHCVAGPEDLDGFEDEDGCRDPDNDRDGFPDEGDRCPNDAEDRDGVEDADGCPDPDNDRDGIPDAADRCPNDAEDRDGVEDADGCPDEDPDRDRDGVPNAGDGCPDAAEDADGFEDADGCPDPDNDRDRIPDAEDKCPGEMETLNGSEDDDGCPDKGAPLAVIDGDDLQLKREIQFRDRPNQPIRQGSYKALEVVAALLQRVPSLKLMVGAYADSPGSPEQNLDVSQRRADSVKAFLVNRGVDGARIEALGHHLESPPTGGAPAGKGEAKRQVTLRLVDR